MDRHTYTPGKVICLRGDCVFPQREAEIVYLAQSLKSQRSLGSLVVTVTTKMSQSLLTLAL